ncbi:hypothetical protein BC831DRAFT_435516 [Entophlyctis helioformis]|nr:hypothetical protein BC831DRAFT_435516 [Entophlyctis helioformis]
MAAGLLSSGIGFLEDYVWSAAINLEADDVGTGAFDPRRSVWHWDCCTPENKAEGGWGLFSSLLGWRNNATISTVTMYCVYWVIVSGILVALRLRESNRAAAKQAAANDEEPVVVAA